MLANGLARDGAMAAGHHPVGMVPSGDFKRAGGFNGLRGLIARKGGNALAIFRRFGIDPDLLDDEETFLPYSTMIRLIDHCAEVLDQPFFGFELAMGQSVDVTGPIGVLLLSSPTVEEGIILVTRYMAIHAPGARLGFSKADGEASVTYEVVEPMTAFSRQINEMSIAVAFKILVAIAGREFRLNGVDISSDPPPCSPHKLDAFFGVPVNYDQPVSALRFPAHFLQRKIDTGNPQLLRFARAHCDTLMQQHDQLASIVAIHIRRLLPMGGCSLPMVARQLSLHPRSLQNRLTSEGLEFREIMRAERLSLAQAYLAETRTPIAEVATLLGYSDQAAFTRAFSAWQGQSPKRYREARKDRIIVLPPEAAIETRALI